MDLFWLEETDIPKGSGFLLFGTEHITAVVLSLISAWTLAFIYCRCKKSGQALPGIPFRSRSLFALSLPERFVQSPEVSFTALLFFS